MMKKPLPLNRARLYNKKHPPFPPDAVPIHRPHKFGNPYALAHGYTRKEAVQLFRNFAYSNLQFLKDIQTELRSRPLLCFCAPLECHGDVLLEIANSPFTPEELHSDFLKDKPRTLF